MLGYIKKFGTFSYYISAVAFLISFFVVSIVLLIQNIVLVGAIIGCLLIVVLIYAIGYLGRWKNNPEVTDDEIIYRF